VWTAGYGTAVRIKPYLLFWCFRNKSLIKKLQILCNKFIRIIFNLRRSQSVNHIMIKYGLLTIEQIRELELSVLIRGIPEFRSGRKLHFSSGSGPNWYNSGRNLQVFESNDLYNFLVTVLESIEF